MASHAFAQQEGVRNNPVHPITELIGGVIFTAIVSGLGLFVAVVVKKARARWWGHQKSADETGSAPAPPPHSQSVHRFSKPSRSVPHNLSIFISYRREDSSDITGRIYDRLVQSFGAQRIFKDVDSIPLGVDFKKHLEEAVARGRMFVVVIGDRWLATTADGKRRIDDPRDLVRIEVESALRLGVPIIPVFIRNMDMPQESELPQSIRNLVYRNGARVRSDPDFHRDVDRLITAIEQHFGVKDSN